MARKKAAPEDKVPVATVLAIARKLEEHRPNYDTQQELGKAYEISQGQVSRYRSLLKEVPKELPPWWPSHPEATRLLRALVPHATQSVGMPIADTWEAKDTMPNRGRALDILSNAYSKGLLAKLKSRAPDRPHAKWSVAEWLRYFMRLILLEFPDA